RMCTGVQVIAVFLGIVVAVPKVDLKRRVMALSVVAVSVHFANIGRIALEIWLLYSGILPWSLAHYPTGLILGVFSVAFLILAADVFIPEIGDLAFSVVDASRSQKFRSALYAVCPVFFYFVPAVLAPQGSSFCLRFCLRFVMSPSSSHLAPE